MKAASIANTCPLAHCMPDLILALKWRHAVACSLIVWVSICPRQRVELMWTWSCDCAVWMTLRDGWLHFEWKVEGGNMWSKRMTVLCWWSRRLRGGRRVVEGGWYERSERRLDFCCEWAYLGVPVSGRRTAWGQDWDQRYIFVLISIRYI